MDYRFEIWILSLPLLYYRFEIRIVSVAVKLDIDWRVASEISVITGTNDPTGRRGLKAGSVFGIS